MGRFRKLSRVAKNLGLASIAGYAGARIASTPAEANKNSITGAGTGFALAAAGMATPKIMKSKLFKDTAKFVFRRIRGRIVPIRKKR